MFTYLRTCLLLGFLVAACKNESRTTIHDSTSLEQDDFQWNIPTNIPLPLVPASNPMSEAKFQLGRHLFYDKRLSGNGTLGCANCHQQSKSFTDGLPKGIGSTGDVHPRSSMALVNIAYVPTLTWANPSLRQLEQQIVLPLFGESPVEHGITDALRPVVLQRLKDEPRYAELFASAFPNEADPVSVKSIVDALSSFVRGLVSFNNPFDRFQRGERDALSDSMLRGRDLYFSEKLECFHCHGGFNLSDSNVDRTMSFIEKPFHNTGLFNIGGNGAYPSDNRGVFQTTENPADMGKFRAVSLRNIEVTAPYMHDGSISSLSDVLDFYAAGGRKITDGPNAGDGRKNPFKDGFISGFTLSVSEKQDVIEFLKSFTDQEFIANERFSDPWLNP